ncbi:hypothetical protein ACJX0J_034209, partial [Zea mays]
RFNDCFQTYQIMLRFLKIGLEIIYKKTTTTFLPNYCLILGDNLPFTLLYFDLVISLMDAYVWARCMIFIKTINIYSKQNNICAAIKKYLFWVSLNVLLERQAFLEIEYFKLYIYTGGLIHIYLHALLSYWHKVLWLNF